MSFTNATGAIYNPVTPGTEQYRREDIAANMTPEQRRAMIQQYEVPPSIPFPEPAS